LFLQRQEASEELRVDQAVEAVKEYASKKDTDVDILYAKLLSLADMVKTSGWEALRVKVDFILKRFLIHKEEHHVAPLVLELLSNPEEVALLAREHRLLKSVVSRKLSAPLPPSQQTQEEVRPPAPPLSSSVPPFMYYGGQAGPGAGAVPPMLPGFMPGYGPWPPTPRQAGPPRRPRARGACFLCHQTGHFVAECPQAQNKHK